MTAEKENKIYSIDESQKAAYQAAGYDIRNDEGEVIAYGTGKTVAYGEYMKLREENEDLKERIADLEKQVDEAAGKTAAKKKAVE